MKFRKLLSFALIFAIVAALAGCGSSSHSSALGSSHSVVTAPMAPAGAMMESAVDYESDMSNGMDSLNMKSDSVDANNLPANRKFIITMNMTAETDDLDSLLAGITDKLTALGGYIQSQNVQNGSNYSGSRRYRSADMTVRIPADKLNSFTDEVDTLSNVVRSSRDTEDVTLNYVDTQSRVRSLEVERDRLMALLEQADNMSDLLEIESRLTDVRYRMEQYARQLLLLDNQIDYATVYLDINEVKEYTPVAERTRWQKICDGFAESLSDLGDGILDFFAWILINIPYIVVWAVIIVVIVFGSKKWHKASQERKRKKIAARYEAMQKAQQQPDEQ